MAEKSDSGACTLEISPNVDDPRRDPFALPVDHNGAFRRGQIFANGDNVATGHQHSAVFNLAAAAVINVHIGNQCRHRGHSLIAGLVRLAPILLSLGHRHGNGNRRKAGAQE